MIITNDDMLVMKVHFSEHESGPVTEHFDDVALVLSFKR